MLKHLVLSIFLTLFVGTASAAIDSISVENLNGKKNIVHKVEAKETYYSIARKYNVTPQSVIQFNSNKSLQIGTILRVPTERPFEESTIINADKKQESNTSAKIAVIDYKVGPREYLLAIAKKFNTTVEDLKTLNNLSSNNLSIGQIIKVPFGSASSEQLAPPPAPPLDLPDMDFGR
jgi:LysM repeat protein